MNIEKLIMFRQFFIVFLTVAMSITCLATPSDDQRFARVNQHDVGNDLYEFLLGTRSRDFLAKTEFSPSAEEEEAYRAKTAKDLILTELLAQEAKRIGINELKNVKVEMEMAAKTLLAQLMVQQIIERFDVDEETLLNKYDAQVATAMYRFKVWNSDTKFDAQALLDSLSSANTNGKMIQIESEATTFETPWVLIDDVDPLIRDEVKALSKGDFASSIAKKKGQWVIVQLIDKNIIDKAAYETEREIIKADILQAHVDKTISALADNATIELFRPDVKTMNISW